MICFAIWPLLYNHHKLSKQVIKRYVLPSNNYLPVTLPKDAKTSVENDCKVHATADSYTLELTS